MVSNGFSTRVGQVAVVVLMAEPGEGVESASVSGEDALGGAVLDCGRQ